MDEEIEMQKILYSFDSSLKIIEDIGNMSKDQLRRVLDKVKKEIDTEDFVVDIELPRIWNTAAFLHVMLYEYDEALICARKWSDRYTQNINSKIIQAFCHLRKAEFSESRPICDELEELRGNKMEVLLAKAEMAFSYSRLGLDMFGLAETAYKEICQQCQDDTDVPVSYVCLWKFGRALTMNRTLNIHNLNKYNKALYTTQRINTIVKLFNEIIETEDDTVPPKCVARAWVELGLLVNATKKGQLKDFVLPVAQERTSEYYFVKALELCPNDIFVLERSGQYYRYNNDIKKSIELLSKAVSIRPTSFGHHHLALSLKRKMEISETWTHPNTQAQWHVVGTKSRAKFRGRNQHSKDMQRSGSALLTERRFRENCDTSYHCRQQNKRKVEYAPDFDKGNVVSRMKTTESEDRRQDSTQDTIDQITTGMSHIQVPEHTAHHRATNEYSTHGAGTTECGGEFPLGNAKDTQKSNANQRKLDNQRDHAAIFNLKNMIKSPKEIQYLEPDETTEKVMFHLDKACTLADNVGALYDKGLMLRQLRKADKALLIFKKITQKTSTSLMLLANSYEQAAFCLIDTETADEDPDIVKKKQYDITTYLKKSIEIGFTMVANNPLLCDAWESLSTLKNLLGNQVKTKGTLKELAFVHEKMQQHKDAIGCYKQIVELEESENKKTEVYLKIVENYQKIGDNDEAVLCLDMIMCLPEVLYNVSPELFLSTYIEGGIDAVKRGETNIAGLRLRKALDYNKSLAKVTQKTKVSVDESDTAIDNDGFDTAGFDIYIYCDESVEDKWRPLKDVLMHAGLRATLNSDDIRPGAMELCGMLGNLEISTHCIVVSECNEETLTPHAQLFVDQVLRDRAKKKHSNVVVVREENTKEMASKLTMFQSVVFRPDGEYTDTCEVSQDTLGDLQRLMYQLATPRK